MKPLALLPAAVLGWSLMGCVSTAEHISPYEAAARERRVLRSDIQVVAEKAVAEANRLAAERDGKIYVDVKEFKRFIYFVPSPDDAVPCGNPTWSVPANAVERQWTDRFALAQQLKYRYALDKITDIRRSDEPSVYFRAKVTCTATVWHRHAYAGKPKPVPQPPDGMQVFHYGARSNFFGSGGPIDTLAAPEMPAGSARPPEAGSLGDQAVMAMQAKPVDEKRAAVVAEAYYDGKRNQWRLRVPRSPKGLPQPERLHGWHGLPQGWSSISDHRVPRRKPEPKQDR